MNFDPHTTEEDAHAIMDTALELGINFFDTANVYGRKLGEGITDAYHRSAYCGTIDRLPAGVEDQTQQGSHKKLDETRYGPGGEAPEAYAW